MSKNFFLLLVVGVILRLILSAIGFHSDIQAFNFTGWVLASGHLFNFYDFLSNLPADSLILQHYPVYLFNYPPAIYYYFIFPTLLAQTISHPLLQTIFLFDVQQLLGNLQLSLHLMLFKLPYMIFDLAIAFLLMKLFTSQREKFLVFILWLFNPITLYATYLVGQFDIIATFFVIAALVVSARHLSVAAVLLGIGALFKIYPLFLLIPLVSLTGNWRIRMKIIAIGILPYILVILPFLPSCGFRSTALVANQTLKSLYTQIPVSGGESIMLFLAALIFFYLIYLRKKILPQFLWQRFFVILLLFFTFTHYHPQWFLWISPFFILVLIKSGFKHVLATLIALFSFIGLLFFFDSGLTLGLLCPIFPNLYNAPSLWQILNLSPDYNFFRSILQTIFAGSALYFIYYYFPGKSED